VKSKWISAERAHAIVMDDIAAEDWHEANSLLLLLVSRPFFGYSKDKQEVLIELTEAQSGAHIE
jgi:hypothetical protein